MFCTHAQRARIAQFCFFVYFVRFDLGVSMSELVRFVSARHSSSQRVKKKTTSNNINQKL